ncbi:124_t:CDS:1, partial [Paraglomus brasilianum]
DISSWTKDDFVNLEKTLHQCLCHIRYHNFEPKEFCESVMPYKKLIPKDIKDDVIQYYMVPEMSTSQWKPRTGTKYHSMKIDSVIIERTMLDLISLWINASKYLAHKRFRYELLLRGTRDGFDNATFHNLCDYKGPTLIVCKPSSGNAIIGGYNPLNWISNKGTYGNTAIIGGYNPLNWFSDNGTYGNTDKSFLFYIKDIDDLDSVQIARVINSAYAVYYHTSYGPCFGGTSDLSANGTNWSSSSGYYPNIGIPRNFSIQEYEVFKVTS